MLLLLRRVTLSHTQKSLEYWVSYFVEHAMIVVYLDSCSVANRLDWSSFYKDPNRTDKKYLTRN